ncbi:MAG: TIGR04086 family membrane protein [Oscillospiraceae bacterium]|nr:TIGR04086 family membrane protein [Oscillospiraceae bacterium]
MIGKGKKSAGGVVVAVLAWLIAAAVCLLLGAVVVSKSGLRQGSLPWLSAAAVFLSSAAAACCYARGGREGKRGKYGSVVGPVCAVVLLMAGFLIDSEKMTLAGLARTVFSAVIGGMAGAAIPAGLHRPARGRKFSVRSRVS